MKNMKAAAKQNNTHLPVFILALAAGLASPGLRGFDKIPSSAAAPFQGIIKGGELRPRGWAFFLADLKMCRFWSGAQLEAASGATLREFQDFLTRRMK